MTQGTQTDGGPAFPVHPGVRVPSDIAGMTLRDWYAGQALAGLHSSLDINGTWSAERLADWAYFAADEMLKKRGGQ